MAPTYPALLHSLLDPQHSITLASRCFGFHARGLALWRTGSKGLKQLKQDCTVRTVHVDVHTCVPSCRCVSDCTAVVYTRIIRNSSQKHCFVAAVSVQGAFERNRGFRTNR